MDSEVTYIQRDMSIGRLKTGWSNGQYGPFGFKEREGTGFAGLHLGREHAPSPDTLMEPDQLIEQEGDATRPKS
jgi:hypothetical protein